MNNEKIKQAMAQLATLNAKIASNSACNASSEENHANAIEIVLDALQGFLELGITPEQMREIDKLYTEKCMELAEEKKKHRWIPCSERMPEESGRYIICAHDDGFENFNKQNQEFVFTANYCDKKQMFEIPFECDEKVYWKLMPNLCLHENKI